MWRPASAVGARVRRPRTNDAPTGAPVGAREKRGRATGSEREREEERCLRFGLWVARWRVHGRKRERKKYVRRKRMGWNLGEDLGDVCGGHGAKNSFSDVAPKILSAAVRLS